MIRNQQGDTIVEVLLATVVIAVVLAGAYTLTNRATRINQSANERTIASKLMQEQIELVRGINISAKESNIWRAIQAKFTNIIPDDSACTPNSSAFYVDTSRTAVAGFDFTTADPDMIENYDVGNPTIDAHPDDFYKVWVQGYQPSGQDYVDIHVRACWEGIGGEAEQSSSVVLRLAL